MNKEDIRAKRIANLKEAQAARKQNSLQQVYQAIERLKKKREKISFNSVAREADVSVSYLYKYPEIKELISNLRQSQIPTIPKSAKEPSKTQLISETSQSKREARLQERIHQLETEKQELKRKNEALAGQVYRAHNLEEQIERQQQTIEYQQQTIEKLQNQLDELSKQQSSSSINSKITFIEQGRLKEGISDEVKSKLSALGLTPNPTLLRTLQAVPTERIISSLEALEEAMVRGSITNPEGWLNKAIKEGWTLSRAAEESKANEVDPKAFRKWFDLAYQRGLVIASTQGEDGKIYIFNKDGIQVPFEQMLAEYPIEG